MATLEGEKEDLKMAFVNGDAEVGPGAEKVFRDNTVSEDGGDDKSKYADRSMSRVAKARAEAMKNDGSGSPRLPGDADVTRGGINADATEVNATAPARAPLHPPLPLQYNPGLAKKSLKRKRAVLAWERRRNEKNCKRYRRTYQADTISVIAAATPPLIADAISKAPSTALIARSESMKRAVLPPILRNKRRRENDVKDLVLDMDETLVHTWQEGRGEACPTSESTFTVTVNEEGRTLKLHVTPRPLVREFLAAMALNFRITVFTAGTQSYADAVLDVIDTKCVIHRRLYRNSCTKHDGKYIKDLSQFFDDLKKVIIVDNNPVAYSWHKENAIRCTDFINDLSDRELGRIAMFLISIKDVEDVRKELSEALRSRYGNMYK